MFCPMPDFIPPPSQPALFAPTGASRLRIWFAWFTLAGMLAVVLSIMSVIRGVGPRAIGAIVGLFAIVSWLIQRVEQRRGAVEADDEGVWSVRRSRSGGLVHWSSIAHMREHSSLGMVDLVDHVGNRLLSLSYDLESFDGLRDLVLSKMAPPRFTPAIEYRTSAADSIPWAIMAVAFFLIASYFLRHDLAALSLVPGVIALAAGAIWFIAPQGVRLTSNRVTLLRRVGSVWFAPADIQNVELLNEPRGPVISYARGVRRRPTPVVVLTLTNGRFYRIKSLNVALAEFCRDLECVRAK